MRSGGIKDRIMRLALAALLAGAGQAQSSDASCVSAADAAAGIRIDYEGGAAGEYRRRSDGLIELIEVGAAADGGNLRFLSRFGLYDLEAGAIVAGAASADRSVSYDYGGQVLPEPQAGADPWVGEVTAVFPGGAVTAETAAYVFGEPGELELGACRYEFVPVRATFVRAEGWEGQGFLYFPALGIAALVHRSGDSQTIADFKLAGFSAVSP